MIAHFETGLMGAGFAVWNRTPARARALQDVVPRPIVVSGLADT
jgi:hypothetical protein